jgi:D-arabinose 1-dehydrogenase-like Zn-dependent alcohol dehydrogenase
MPAASAAERKARASNAIAFLNLTSIHTRRGSSAPGAAKSAPKRSAHAPPEARARINVNQLVYAEKTLKGSIYGSTRPRLDLLTLIDLHAQGKIDLDSLLTRTYPLSQINEAYAALDRGEVARSLVMPQEG